MNVKNEAGPSRAKQFRTTLAEELKGEEMLFESDSDEDYFCDSCSESENVGSLNEFIKSEPEDEETSQDMYTHQNLPCIDENEISGKWQDEETEMFAFPFTKQNELLVPAMNQGNPMDYFRLLFDDSFLQMLVDETNNYAEIEFLRDGGAMQPRISAWKPTDKHEILTFIALIIHTGTIKINRLNDYWKEHHLINLPCFSDYMSRDRFLIILKCFHFAPSIETKDRFHKIRPLITYFNRKMDTIYYPRKELVLEEPMVFSEDRLQFPQYNENRFHKYGTKLYMLTEPQGIILKCAVFIGGIDDDLGRKDQTDDVVLDLLSNMLNSGHSLYMDSFYNSFDLATKLIENKTFCTGILKKNTKNTPQEIVKQEKLNKGDTVCKYSQGVMFGKWKDQNDIVYLSTEFNNNMILDKNHQSGIEKINPEPLINYYRFMGGVKRQKQMKSYYPYRGKLICWYKQIGIHIIQMLLMNSFYLYNQYNVESIVSLCNFRLAILNELLPIKPRT